MNLNYDKDQEEAHYHFALAEIVYYISQHGIDSVMTDIYNYIEMEKVTYHWVKEKTLTDEEILKMAADRFHYSEYKLVIEFARAILRKAQG